LRIDLDHNATTRVDPRVASAMVAALGEAYGNPSSIHEEGRRSRDLVERARAEVAALIGASPPEIVFTSGGTEADVLGIVGGARAAGRRGRVVTSPLEHPAARGACAALAAEGWEVVEVPVDAAGRIAPGDIPEGAALASFALANHELGNLYDVPAFARQGMLLHCDAVQAVGKLPVDVRALGADLVAISAHKIHGPKGVGALWVRRGVDLGPLHAAGHQERGLRPGTENVAGIAGFGEAARIARLEGPASWARVAALRDRLEDAALRIPGARVHGDRARRVVNTTNLAFTGVPGDVLVQALDLEGVSASTGAACTSGTVEPSPVVRALGAPKEAAREAVRFSLGRDSTEEEIGRVAEMLPRLVARIRAALG
jgi:cysteine desulfurase